MASDLHKPESPAADTQDRAASDAGDLKTVLFVDYENARHAADRLFGDRIDNDGYFHPRKLGQLICEQHNRQAEAQGLPQLRLTEVRVYRGQPDPEAEPKRRAEHLARKYAWLDLDDEAHTTVEDCKITVIDPPLHYPRASHPRWAGRTAFEQEIDTQITVDALTMAVQGAFDVAVLFSEDKDFLPVMSELLARYSEGQLPQVHRAGWCRRLVVDDPQTTGGKRWRQNRILDSNDHRLGRLGSKRRSPKHRLWLSHYEVVADQASYLNGWDELERCYDAGDLVRGRVVGCGEHGLYVSVKGAVAFAPRKQLVDEDTRVYDRRTLEFKVIEFDHKTRTAILSERAALRRSAVSRLKKGDSLTVRINKIQSGRVFVEHGGVSWRVPANELSWSQEGGSGGVFSVGQAVRVRVLAARAASEELNLSIRQAAREEWDNLVARLRTEPFVAAEVVGRGASDVGVRIMGTYIHGRIPVSELVDDDDMAVDDVVEEGNLVPVKIVDVNRTQRGERAAGRIKLSVLQARTDAEEAGWEFDSTGRVVHAGGGWDGGAPATQDKATASLQATDAQERKPKPGDAEPSTALGEALLRAGISAKEDSSESE